METICAFKWQVWIHAILRSTISATVCWFLATPLLIKALSAAGVTLEREKVEGVVLVLAMAAVEAIRNRLKHGGKAPRLGIKKLL